MGGGGNTALIIGANYSRHGSVNGFPRHHQHVASVHRSEYVAHELGVHSTEAASNCLLQFGQQNAPTPNNIIIEEY